MAEILRYLIAGGLNTLITFVAYVVLLHFGVVYYVANACAWILGIVCAYFYGLYFVFNQSVAQRPRPNIIQFFKFSLTYGASFLLSTFALASLIESQLVNSFWAQAIVIPFIVIFNFLSSKFIIFRQAKR